MYSAAISINSTYPPSPPSSNNIYGGWMDISNLHITETDLLKTLNDILLQNGNQDAAYTILQRLVDTCRNSLPNSIQEVLDRRADTYEDAHPNGANADDVINLALSYIISLDYLQSIYATTTDPGNRSWAKYLYLQFEKGAHTQPIDDFSEVFTALRKTLHNPNNYDSDTEYWKRVKKMQKQNDAYPWSAGITAVLPRIRDKSETNSRNNDDGDEDIDDYITGDESEDEDEDERSEQSFPDIMDNDLFLNQSQ